MKFLEILGDPIPLMRHRSFLCGKHIRSFDPQTKQKEQVRWQLRSQFTDELITVPIALEVKFYMKIPKSTSKVRTKEMIQGKIHHIKRPDIDNLLKFVLDCMNGVIFKDDSQVCVIHAEKIYAEKGHTIIRIFNPA